jgi:hypothetical protein
MNLRPPSCLLLLLTSLHPPVIVAADPLPQSTNGGWQSGPAVPAPAVAAPVTVAAPPTSDSGWNAGPSTPAATTSSPAVTGPALPSNYAPADKLLVLKSERVLRLLNRGRTVAEYPVRLGLNPVGHKLREGDFRTPEGVYSLSRRNPRSEFFLSLEVSYPNDSDRRRASSNGHRPGGLIMIHGQPNLPRKPVDYYASNDWTDGCIAVSNSDMVDIWLRAPLGIPIEIRP